MAGSTDHAFTFLGLAAFVALAAVSPVLAQGHVPGPEYDKVKDRIERYESPGRADWQKPAVILRVLGVEKGDRVADIGAGSGYLLPFLATLVGPPGKVWAVDIDADLLAYLEKRFPSDNVETVLAEPNDPLLPDGAVDTIVLVNTWHHIEKRPAYIKKLEKALKPDGRVGIVDFHDYELPVGPPVGHKLDKKKVLKEFDKAGWRLLTESTALPYQYFFVLAPPAPERPLSDETPYPPGTTHGGS